MAGESARKKYSERTSPVLVQARLDPPEQVGAMLARYPNVSCAEAAEIAAFLRTARYLDVERMRSDSTVRRQLDLFVRHHRHALKASAVEIVSAIALVVGFLSICWLLWHSLGPGAGS